MWSGEAKTLPSWFTPSGLLNGLSSPERQPPATSALTAVITSRATKAKATVSWSTARASDSLDVASHMSTSSSDSSFASLSVIRESQYMELLDEWSRYRHKDAKRHSGAVFTVRCTIRGDKMTVRKPTVWDPGTWACTAESCQLDSIRVILLW